MTEDAPYPDAPQPPPAEPAGSEPDARPAAAPPPAPPAKAPSRSLFGRRRVRPQSPQQRPPSRRELRVERRRNRRKRRASAPMIVAADSIITLLVVVLVAAAAVYYAVDRGLSAPGPLAEAKSVIIPRGAGARDMGELLENNGIVDNHWMFVAGVETARARSRLKAGEYRIPAHASIRQIIALIASGKVVEHPITIPEGLTSQQIVARLRSEPVLSGEIDVVPPEGSLLPETYNEVRGTPREDVLAAMTKQDKEAVAQIWAGRAPGLPLKSPEELVTLASVVEKETGLAAERPRVAAVFINRLKKGMRLQSDPTIIYGMVGGQGSLGRPLTRDDVARPTPYNTYTIRGLPPGPITNPGRASLEAAAHPADTDDLYFVADGSGGHAFATTLAAHRRNVERLRQIEASRAEENATPGAMPQARPQ
jgi:UPF0755 protein